MNENMVKIEIPADIALDLLNVTTHQIVFLTGTREKLQLIVPQSETDSISDRIYNLKIIEKSVLRCLEANLARLIELDAQTWGNYSKRVELKAHQY